MCGIAGIFDMKAHRQVNVQILQDMQSELAHRGPDGEGVTLGKGFGFSHRRLSIIDPEGGQQPMASSCGNITITFNGMIYNYKTLRKRLSAVGHSFKTESDTEVLLYAYKAWGTDMCKYLDGFYAFAIYDAHNETLFAARDPWGKKPFYYTIDGNFFFHFASEMPALMKAFTTKPSLSARALDNYFAMGFIPAPKTLYDNVHKLHAGHHLILKRTYNAPVIQSFTPLRPQEINEEVSYKDVVSQVETLLHKSLEKRLVADVPIGVLLSGGTDSACVTYFASKIAKGEKIKTFTAGFADNTYDERSYARELSRHLGTDHTELLIDAPEENIIDDIAMVAGEPYADASLIPTYLICQKAKEHSTVLLSGDGADEISLGYARYQSFARQEHIKSFCPEAIRHFLFNKLGEYYPQSAKVPYYLRAGATFEALADNRAGGYLRNFAISRAPVRRALFADNIKEILGHYDTKFFVKKYFDEASYLNDPIKQAQYVDIYLWLAGRMMTKSDRASMSVGVEMRSPFLDHDLATLLLSLPSGYLHHKRIFKDIIRQYLPEGYLDRPKRGFVFPLSEMLRNKWHDRLYTVINDSYLEQMGIFDHKFLRRLYRQHMSRTHDHSRLLWAVIQFDAYLTNFK